MKLKNQILTGMGALAFMALLVINVQLVNSKTVKQAGFAFLSLVELEVQAQSEGEGGCEDCLPEETCIEGDCILIPSNCLVVGNAMPGKRLNLLKCMQDAADHDIFIGYTNTCEPAQYGICNPHSCKVVPGCFTKPI